MSHSYTAHEMLKDLESLGMTIRDLEEHYEINKDFLYRAKNDPDYGVTIDKRTRQRPFRRKKVLKKFEFKIDLIRFFRELGFLRRLNMKVTKSYTMLILL